MEGEPKGLNITPAPSQRQVKTSRPARCDRAMYSSGREDSLSRSALLDPAADEAPGVVVASVGHLDGRRSLSAG